MGYIISSKKNKLIIATTSNRLIMFKYIAIIYVNNFRTYKMWDMLNYKNNSKEDLIVILVS